jgi:hypothetical protein
MPAAETACRRPSSPVVWLRLPPLDIISSSLLLYPPCFYHALPLAQSAHIAYVYCKLHTP